MSVTLDLNSIDIVAPANMNDNEIFARMLDAIFFINEIENDIENLEENSSTFICAVAISLRMMERQNLDKKENDKLGQTLELYS